MATISFLYRSTKEKAPLKVRFFYMNKGKESFIEVSTKSEVTKEYWQKHHKAKRIADISIKNFQNELLFELNSLENHIHDASMIVNVDRYNKEWLVGVVDDYYNPVVEADIPVSFLDWCDVTAEDKKADLTYNTKKKNKVSLRVVTEFIVSSKKEWFVKDIGIQFKREFESYCLSKGYSNNTISVFCIYVKSVCNYAAMNGVEVSTTLNLVRVKEEPVDNIYLTEEEIEKIKNVELPSDYLDNARDWLLISCYTGQRIGDFMRFDKSMIRCEENRKGELKSLLEFVQEKTGKRMSIPLSKKALEVLSKRDGEFPRATSDQKYNKYIKEVCEAAELTEMVFGAIKSKTEKNGWRMVEKEYPKYKLVASHIGRRSFATNNYGKIPTMYLKEITGHSTEQMFLKYIGKGSKDIAMEMFDYFD